jgi:hypothetical protein
VQALDAEAASARHAALPPFVARVSAGYG